MRPPKERFVFALADGLDALVELARRRLHCALRLGG
jgi:hypothetical protein